MLCVLCCGVLRCVLLFVMDVCWFVLRVMFGVCLLCVCVVVWCDVVWCGVVFCFVVLVGVAVGACVCCCVDVWRCFVWC